MRIRPQWPMPCHQANGHMWVARNCRMRSRPPWNLAHAHHDPHDAFNHVHEVLPRAGRLTQPVGDRRHPVESTRHQAFRPSGDERWRAWQRAYPRVRGAWCREKCVGKLVLETEYERYDSRRRRHAKSRRVDRTIRAVLEHVHRGRGTLGLAGVSRVTLNPLRALGRTDLDPRCSPGRPQGMRQRRRKRCQQNSQDGYPTGESSVSARSAHVFDSKGQSCAVTTLSLIPRPSSWSRPRRVSQ